MAVKQSNITPVQQAVVFPSSINNVAGKLLSERNLSLILRCICSRHFIYTTNPHATTGNFNINLDSYSVISPGIAVIDGYVVTISNSTNLINIPTDKVAFGEVKPFYLALHLGKQKTSDLNVGNNLGLNDIVYDKLTFEFLEDKLEDTTQDKYLYLYKMNITQNSIDVNTIEDLRNYSPFDVSSISAHTKDLTKTLSDVLQFIMVNIRGLDENADFFDTSDKTIPIEGDNGIYDRLKYKFTLPDYPTKPFINDMIVSGNEILYDQGQIVTLNGDSRLPNIILPEAGNGKDNRGAIFINANRRTINQEYDPQKGNQILFLENGELYSVAEINQNAFSIIKVKNSANESINILIPSINKIDTLTVYGSSNVNIKGNVTTEERQLLIDLNPDISVNSIKINETQIIPYNDADMPKFSGIGINAGLEAQNGTIEEDLRVRGNLEVGGDSNFAGDVNIVNDLTCSGAINAERVYSAVYNDYAEIYECNPNDILEPGDIIMYDPDQNIYCKATQQYGNLAIGVYSDSYGFIVGGSNGFGNYKEIPVGLCGRVKVKIIGPINFGDLIEVSSIDGVGRKSDSPKPGYIIGKCLQRKDSLGTERVTMQIMLA